MNPRSLAERAAALPPWAVILASSVGLFVIYFASAEASYHFVIPPSRSAVFWLPSGVTVALAVRVRGRTWLWPGLALALLLGQLVIGRRHGLPYVVALSWSIANVSLFLSNLLLARKFVEGPFSLARLRDVFVLVGMTVLSVLPSALIAAGASAAVLATSFLPMTWSWAASDAIGIVLVAPMILAWSAPGSRPAGQLREAGLLLGVLAVLTGLIFFRAGATELTLALPSVPFLVVAWASIRFGPRATTLALLIVDLMMVSATVLGVGPFAAARLSPAVLLLNLQVLVVIYSVVMLLLAAAIEEQHEARSVAEASIRTRDEFLSVASHELNTPLTSLQLSVEGLMDRKDWSPEASDQLHEVMCRQVRRLTRLVDDLLDSTRIRQGQIQLHHEHVELVGLVRDVARRIADLAARAGSSIEVRASGPIQGRWDSARLDQVITNLLSNAVKFGDGKPIELTVRPEGDDGACVIVRDHGIGIPPGRLPQIFERFEQAIEPRHYGGLGLGLHIARSLVELHGGRIAAASTPGAGSTFTVMLPRLPSSGGAAGGHGSTITSPAARPDST